MNLDNIINNIINDINMKNERARNLEERLKNSICCSECGKLNDKDNNYCISCNHKLKNISKKDKIYKEYCPICKELISSDMDYCGKYGHEIKRNVKEKMCPICGKWVVNEKYCLNCGHDFSMNMKFYSPILKMERVCSNCNEHYTVRTNYCEECGTKLKRE